MSMMDSDFVGSRVVYRLFGAMMHWTLQKFIVDSYFVKKILIGLNVSYTCTTMGKKLKNFNNHMRSNS